MTRSEDNRRLYLFDDAVAKRFRPFATSRPVGELLFGCLLLRERTERVLGLSCAGHLAGPALVGFREPEAPEALDSGDVSREGERVLVSSRAVLEPFEDGPLPSGPATLTVAGEPAGWIVPAGEDLPSDDALSDPGAHVSAAKQIDLPGRMLASPWEAMGGNADQVARDIERRDPARGDSLPEGVEVLGGYRFSLAADTRVEPGVVVDVTAGPVRIEAGATVRAFTRLAGPAWIGPGSTVFGGSVGRVSLGPVCKIRGEVEDTVVLGYSNKAHDGFLGHAYLGRWVNLGALTTNSDLKNTYGPVRLTLPDGEVDTGQTKVGCFLGDHVKTGIGTLLNTGTVVGMGSNLFGGTMPPKYVPPFSWGAGADLQPFRLDRFLELARTVMGRRGQELTDAMVTVYTRAWEAAAAAGERA